MNRISIRRFLFRNLIYTIFIPILILGVAGIFIPSRILSKEISAADKNQAILIETLVEYYLDAPLQGLMSVVSIYESGLIKDTDEMTKALRLISAANDDVLNLQYADARGHVIAVYPRENHLIGTDVSGHDYFHETMKGDKIFWSPSFISEYADYPMSTVSIPFENGVLTAFFSLTNNGKIRNAVNLLGSGQLITVTDQNGVYIVSPDNRKVLLREYSPIFYEAKKHWEGERLIWRSEYEGKSYITNINFLEDTGWMIVLYRSVKEFETPIKTLYLWFISLLIFVVLISVFIGGKLSNRLSIPLEILVSSVKTIAGGDYNIKLPEIQFTELDLLSEAFQKMSVEIRLRENELRYTGRHISNIIDSMQSILVGVNEDLIITLWNRQAVEKTGLTAEMALGQSIEHAIPRLSVEMDRIREAVTHGVEKSDLKHPSVVNGNTLYEDIMIYPLSGEKKRGAVIRISDVTGQVKMQEMLIQNEKMLSVGGLAAGMAHEINNPLAGLLQTLSVMGGRLGNETGLKQNLIAAEEVGISLDDMKRYMEIRELPRMMESISESGKRIAAIVENMLTFARKDESKVTFCNIPELLDSTLELASTDFNLKKKFDFKKISILREYEEFLPEIPCERGKIQQVILNILQNGAQALAGENIPDPEFRLKASCSKATDSLVFEIGNNGPPISDDLIKHIFEPFFTTKPVGEGTGLGLSVSYFIVTENHKGTMRVESNDELGVNFVISLPLTVSSENQDLPL
ncbi:MAG: PAS domain-containing protein [Spirochaetales bacterium]|nr:PAS domain-containing protein [Spirochaetales bacterium]